MRPIKLRIWHKAERMMFLATSITFNKKGDVIAGYARELLGEFAWAIDEVELLQFTGLLDCNGKEIFEGDVVFSKEWQPNEYEIGFRDGCFCLKHPRNTGGCYPNAIYAQPMEIIGNIYENKELLEKQDDK